MVRSEDVSFRRSASVQARKRAWHPTLALVRRLRDADGLWDLRVSDGLGDLRPWLFSCI